MKPRTFIIGDVHGHIDRLQALLSEAGIKPGDDIVQLGDLGHFGAETAERDEECYLLAQALGMTVLWGNHDRAVVDPGHAFKGYVPPSARMIAIMTQVGHKFAVARHGYLMTHAGLHPKFVVPGATVEETADLLNEGVTSHSVNAIGKARGGPDQEGGIIWRDDREPIARVNQVYGHTRGLVRRARFSAAGPDRWCIDVGDRGETGNLVGLWLPDLTLVSVGPDAGLYSQAVDR